MPATPPALAVITVLQPITVIFTIGQDDIPTVLTHMAGDPNLEVDAFSRDLTKRLATGTLSAIDNQVDPGSGTVRCAHASRTLIISCSPTSSSMSAC
jgi:multidrug efflux system membrane fusion protein